MAPAVIEVVGSLNIDLVSVTRRIPGPGETLASRSFSTGFGGKGANQAVACARALRQDATQPTLNGIQIHHVGAVGSDQFGKDFIEHLRNEHVSTDKVMVKEGCTTGTAVIIVEEATGENRILVSAGANGQVTAEDVQLSVPSGPDEPHIVLYQLEIPLETVVTSIKAAKALGKTVVLNPAPAVPLDDELYPYIDHLVVNESEASLLSGFPEDTLTDSLNKVAKIFCDKGVRNVVITLGRAGVFVQTAEAAKGNYPGMRVRAHKVEVVDTTAAGDTFLGTYAAMLAAYGLDYIEHAATVANLAAARAVEKAGAQSSIPFRGELRPPES